MKIFGKYLFNKKNSSMSRRASSSPCWMTGQLACMLIFSAMILLLPLQVFGSESMQARAEIQRIKAQQNLSGQDKARVAHKYIQSLSDEQLMALLQQLGAGRFLARLPRQGDPRGNAGEGRPRPSAKPPVQLPHSERNGLPSSPEQIEANRVPPPAGQPVDRNDKNRIDRRQQQRQLEIALRDPQDRERLTRAVTNYLLNAAPQKKP